MLRFLYYFTVNVSGQVVFVHGEASRNKYTDSHVIGQVFSGGLLMLQSYSGAMATIKVNVSFVATQCFLLSQ